MLVQSCVLIKLGQKLKAQQSRRALTCDTCGQVLELSPEVRKRLAVQGNPRARDRAKDEADLEVALAESARMFEVQQVIFDFSKNECA